MKILSEVNQRHEELKQLDLKKIQKVNELHCKELELTQLKADLVTVKQECEDLDMIKSASVRLQELQSQIENLESSIDEREKAVKDLEATLTNLHQQVHEEKQKLSAALKNKPRRGQ